MDVAKALDRIVEARIVVILELCLELFHFFAEPSGFRWEVAWNPGWRVEPDGRARLDAAAEGDVGD